jgi:hypothetical protein
LNKVSNDLEALQLELAFKVKNVILVDDRLQQVANDRQNKVQQQDLDDSTSNHTASTYTI